MLRNPNHPVMLAVAAARRPTVIRAATVDRPELYIYGEIGWDVMAKEVVAALQTVSGRDILVHLNSPGGNVFEGITIANALRAHKGEVTVQIDALAASIASIIALGGKRIVMAENAFYMIHNPFTCACGTAEDFRALADTLDKVGKTLRAEYVKRSGAKAEQVQQWMDDETWFDAAEAVEAGFASEIIGASEEEARIVEGMFKNTPDKIAAVAAPALKLVDGTPTVREVERVLREAGLSRTAARALVAHYSPSGTPRDADERYAEAKAAGRRLLASITQTT